MLARSPLSSHRDGTQSQPLASWPPVRKAGVHKYEVIIYWSSEDASFVAEVPELPGCSAHGDSRSAALQNIEQAIELWVDTAREFGDPIPASANA